MHPLYIQQIDQVYVYIRKIPPDMDYNNILYSAAQFMTDLAGQDYSFDRNAVSIVLHTQPGPPQDQDASEAQPSAISEELNQEAIENEIWITRTMNPKERYPPYYSSSTHQNPYTGTYVDNGYEGGSHKVGESGSDGDDFSDTSRIRRIWSGGRNHISGGNDGISHRPCLYSIGSASLNDDASTDSYESASSSRAPPS